MRNHISRREAITILGGAAAAWPQMARAQQRATMPVVGYPGMPEQSAGVTQAFRRGLSEVGFVEGRNVTIEYRFARTDPSRIPDLAADLVRRRVAVIAATGGVDVARSAMAATTTIPIVFEIGSDPVEDGLVASFNRPGGNVTGVTAMNLDLDGKRLSLLVELAPTATRIGVLTTSLTSSVAQARIRYLPTAAAALGRQIEVLHAPDSRQVDEAFAGLTQKRIDALYIGPSPIYDSLRVQIATAASRYAKPVIYPWRSFVDAGGLMSYGPIPDEDWRWVGTYVGRILKGEKPADLPVMRPTKFEFVINLQTARLLRVEVPPTLLALADAVIE